MHQQAAAVFDAMLDRIAAIQKAAREEGSTARPAWPMLIMRTPKGWTGPKFVDGKPVEGTWRAHQVPLDGIFQNPAAVNALLSYLHEKKGLPFTHVPAVAADPYDALADLFEEHVDMDAIVAMLKMKTIAGKK